SLNHLIWNCSISKSGSPFRRCTYRFFVENYENRREEETGEKRTLFSEDGGPLTDNVVFTAISGF
ncbi:hypothetical protein, partial [Mesotoga sp. HF07.pep.5.2.highcov]|uniref:hypothetical protein n=1 Tax=Mesotoga sp. HF07.pep.5.2.highcov TaxID=1462923 RepID=UPI001C7D27E1